MRWLLGHLASQAGLMGCCLVLPLKWVVHTSFLMAVESQLISASWPVCIHWILITQDNPFCSHAAAAIVSWHRSRLGSSAGSRSALVWEDGWGCGQLQRPHVCLPRRGLAGRGAEVCLRSHGVTMEPLCYTGVVACALPCLMSDLSLRHVLFGVCSIQRAS